MQHVSRDNHRVKVLGEAWSARGFERLACLTPLRNKIKQPVKTGKLTRGHQGRKLISRPLFWVDIESHSLSCHSEWFVSDYSTLQFTLSQRGNPDLGLKTPAHCEDRPTPPGRYCKCGIKSYFSYFNPLIYTHLWSIEALEGQDSVSADIRGGLHPGWLPHYFNDGDNYQIIAIIIIIIIIETMMWPSHFEYTETQTQVT